jgi:hypothetical protein
MNRSQRQALYRLLNHAASDAALGDDMAILRLLLEPRPRGHRAVVPRRDQIHMPFSDVRNEIREVPYFR